MALESGTYINSLNVSNPASTDALAQADDHLRLIKSTIKATFPNVSGAVTLTHAEINALQGLAGNLSAPQGTQMVFATSPAPVGWTTQTANNNKALRVVNGSTTLGTGGSVNFTTAFQTYTPTGSVNSPISGSIAGVALTVNQIPAHRHFTVANVTSHNGDALSSSNQTKRGGFQELTTFNDEAYHLGGVSTDATIGRTSSVGSSQTHTHGRGTLQVSSSFTGNTRDFSVQYVDIIIAQKD